MSIYYDVVDNYRHKDIKGDLGLVREEKVKLAEVLKYLTVDIVIETIEDNKRYQIISNLLHIVMESTIGFGNILEWCKIYSPDCMSRKLKRYKTVKDFIESSVESKLELSKQYKYKPDWLSELFYIAKDINKSSYADIKVKQSRYERNIRNIRSKLDYIDSPYMDTNDKGKYINLHNEITKHIRSVA